MDAKSKSKDTLKNPLQTIMIVPQLTYINSVAINSEKTEKPAIHLSYPTQFPFSITIGKKFFFHVLKKLGNQRMILCADSQLERKDWIRCLRARVREWEVGQTRLGKNTVAFKTISTGISGVFPQY
jgi:hypothetical protein